MAIRNILQHGEETLSKKSRPVSEFNEKLDLLLGDLLDTMKSKDGVGLAAPQVGVLRRVCIIDIGEGLIELINPEIIDQKGRQEEIEGCLSSPGKYGKTVRPFWVKVKALDRRGNLYTVEGNDLMARALCHELDHLDGIEFYTHVTEMIDPEEINAEH